MKNCIITCMILFSILVGRSFAQTTNKGLQVKDTLFLDFKQSLTLLESGNDLIKAASYEQQQRIYERKAATGLYLPNIGLSASYVMMSDPITLDLTPVKNAITPLYSSLITIGTYAPTVVVPAMSSALQTGLTQINETNWNQTIQKDKFLVTRANFTWPIYTGGKILAANKAAAARSDEAGWKVKQVTNQQISQLVERYYGLKLMMHVATLRKDVMDGMQKHLNDAIKMEQNGIINEAERLHAEVTYADAEREYKKALKDVNITQVALQNVISTDKMVVPLSRLFIFKNLDSLSIYCERAIANNPSLMQLSEKEKQANMGIVKERSEFLPEAFAFGNKNLYDVDLTEYSPDWMVGVGLKINIFDGLAKERKLKAAKMTKDQVVSYEAKAKADITTLVTSIYQKMQQADEQFESCETSLKFAKEYLRVREKAFAEGYASSSELVDAQLNLFKVKTERLKAMYDFDIELAHLLEVIGSSEEFESYLNNQQTINYEE